MIRASTAALLLTCALAAHGGQVSLSEIAAQPLAYTRGGEVQGCGLRLTGGEASKPASSWFDVSLNVFQRGVGLAQTIAYEFRGSGAEGDSRPERVPVQRSWVKRADGHTRIGENAERRESLVYLILADDVLELFEAVAHAEPVTLGVRTWGQTQDAVFTGIPVLTEESRRTMSRCLEALTLS